MVQNRQQTHDWTLIGSGANGQVYRFTWYSAWFFIYLLPWFISWRLSPPQAAWLPVFNIISACLVPYSWCWEVNLIFLGKYLLRKGKFSYEKVSLFLNLGCLSCFSDSENGVPKRILSFHTRIDFKGTVRVITSDKMQRWQCPNHNALFDQVGIRFIILKADYLWFPNISDLRISIAGKHIIRIRHF